MKIASVTIYCDESFRLSEWLNYYNEYKEEIYLHVIVNNGKLAESEKLKSLFPDSLILNSTNKSLTFSNNIALNKILLDKEVDAILLISNDIKIEHGNISKLYKFLFSKKEFGMVSPILFKKDSEIIESFGAQIDKTNLRYLPLNNDMKLDQLSNDEQLCDIVPGGMNLAKRAFYENVGLQDEYIYMYADEVDIGIRGGKLGFKFAATKNVVAWHQHIYPNGKKTRNPLAAYLWGRNEIYLAKKHFSKAIVFNTVFFRIKYAAICLASVWLRNRDKELKVFYWYYFKGILAGVFNLKIIPENLTK